MTIIGYLLSIYFHLRLTNYLALNEKERDIKQIDRFGQFDVAYHNISFDEDEPDQGWKFSFVVKIKF